MIIVDTNVLSEAMRDEPAAEVMRWFAAQNPESLFTTSITGAEIFYGISIMPAGRKKLALERAADAILTKDFDGRVLSFDMESATRYAAIAALPRASKDDVSVFDVMIAAIAISRKAPVATRNVRHFAPLGVSVINPWNHPVP